MLKLTEIRKVYKVADTEIHALRGLTIAFRENEFVSILGPSGCGKTTLLNIIGGLDKMTDGDLSIYGKSTKEYTDRDWDVYRNHRIGFIFQSYNLIPHQTVLGNVELALTIAGMTKAERVEKAKAALAKVGLEDQCNKKPNQLSGGQCQRVAIARSLVNDPEILLADEPTGALDTKTGVEIMELIKEIAKEHLVIMVTHNPELAEKYSTRIVRLLDGELKEDTNPFSVEDEEAQTKASNEKREAAQKEAEALALAEGKKVATKEKAKMSFWTAFKLSCQNLLTKAKRTVMTAIAGSIGIIGVSMVLSVSIGMQAFIDNMQNDMLSGNPIEITRDAFDIATLMSNSSNNSPLSKKDAAKQLIAAPNSIMVQSMIEELNERMKRMENIRVTNNITKSYIDFVKDMDPKLLSALMLDYELNVSNSIYTSFSAGANFTAKNSSLTAISATYGSILEKIPEFASYASMISGLSQPFKQAPNAEDYLKSQYDIKSGRIAKEKNEVMIVLSKKKELADLTLANLGYYTQEQFINLVNKAVEKPYDEVMYNAHGGNQMAYSTLLNKGFTWYPNDTIFEKSTKDAVSEPFTYKPYSENTWEGGQELKVVGILEPKENLSYGMLDSGFYYTEAFAQFAAEQNWNSQIAQYLRREKTESLAGTAVLIREGQPVPGTNGRPAWGVSGATMIKYMPSIVYMLPPGTDVAEFRASYVPMTAVRDSTNSDVIKELTFSLGNGGQAITIHVDAVSYGDPSDETRITDAVVRFVDPFTQTVSPQVIIEEGEDLDFISMIKAKEDTLSVSAGGVVRFEYEYTYENNGVPRKAIGLVGSSNSMLQMISSFFGAGGGTGVTMLTMTLSAQSLGANVQIKDKSETAKTWEVELFDGQPFSLPSRIAIYPLDLTKKKAVLKYLDRWNDDGDITLKNGTVILKADREKIVYTDMLSIIMGLISSLLSIITIALVGFTSLALIVSCVMIAIITYVSVVERIKEIGVIRSLGGRKRDVSNLFIAETVVIGLASGLIGIIVTYILSAILNAVVVAAGIPKIALFPPLVAFIMVCISVGLTLISGLSPSASAAKKDPVVALRTE